MPPNYPTDWADRVYKGKDTLIFKTREEAREYWLKSKHKEDIGKIVDGRISKKTVDYCFTQWLLEEKVIIEEEMWDWNITEQPKPNIEIWIAENVCYTCRGEYNLFRRFWLWLLLGWKVTKIK